MPKPTCRHPLILSAAAVALLVAAGPGDAVAQPAPARTTKTAEQLADEWTATAAGLVRRAEAGGHAELAALIRDWQLPSEADRQFVLDIPSRLAAPDWIDTPEEQSLWTDFMAARRATAAGTFALALDAARAAPPSSRDAGKDDDGLPLPDREPGAAVRLLHRVLRDDPDHAAAREAGGWVRRDGQWVWPEAARRLDKGEEYSAEFGWLPRGRQERYRAGERYHHGRWIKAGAEPTPPRGPAAKGPPDPRQVWKFTTDHWQVGSTAGMDETAKLASQLELTRAVWLQVFGGFACEPAEWERRLEGRSRPADHGGGGRGPFAAMLVADRAAYVAALEAVEPLIGRTLGIYWTPTHTAWFFPGEGQEPTTVHHEAAHQLFAEIRKTSPLAGERCGFWAIEAAACYLESLEPAEFGWTVGGRDAGRAPAARERLLDDGFHVPLAEIAAMGRRGFQSDERLPQIYSEISGLADFFMNGRHGRYREAFVAYLARVYTGTVDPDTLARLCHRSYAQLDDEYRQHMAR
jgi:hypothetical protein